MFSWVVKVVPQPSEKPAKPEEGPKGNALQTSEQKASVKEQDVNKAANPAKPKADEVSEENSSQGGVLTWISHGLTSALPQPAATPKTDRAESEAKQQEENSNRTGVMNWIVQGLSKVVPQPDDKNKQQAESQEVIEVPKVVPEVKVEPSEVKVLKVEPEPPPQLSVVEVVPDAEPEGEKTLTPRVVEWIKQGFEKVVPQPGHSSSIMDTSDKKELATDTAPLPPKELELSVAEQTTNVEEESNVVGWLVQGLGRIMPQPILKAKEDTSDTVQSREKAMRAP